MFVVFYRAFSVFFPNDVGAFGQLLQCSELFGHRFSLQRKYVVRSAALGTCLTDGRCRLVENQRYGCLRLVGYLTAARSFCGEQLERNLATAVAIENKLCLQRGIVAGSIRRDIAFFFPKSVGLGIAIATARETYLQCSANQFGDLDRQHHRKRLPGGIPDRQPRMDNVFFEIVLFDFVQYKRGPVFYHGAAVVNEDELVLDGLRPDRRKDEKERSKK